MRVDWCCNRFFRPVCLLESFFDTIKLSKCLRCAWVIRVRASRRGAASIIIMHYYCNNPTRTPSSPASLLLFAQAKDTFYSTQLFQFCILFVLKSPQPPGGGAARTINIGPSVACVPNLSQQSPKKSFKYIL